MGNSPAAWWKDGTVYQIYPASFKDSNGDGLGDIPGIISKIDYLKNLGIDVVWVSPMFASPMVDNGYDISNYEDVHPPFGTLADMEQLIAACHERKMRIILDLVVNHTSDQHAWFQESRSSKTNPKRDWYIWRPARYTSSGTRLPPNNWRSFFSGSAWTWDEHTQEYYLRCFAPEQPDLNWENDETRKAIYASAIRFWLEKGVDGFRIDTVNMYSKAPGLPDAPIVDPDVFAQPAMKQICNGPRMHEWLREIHRDVLSNYDTMTVGELPHTPEPAEVLTYVGAGDRQMDMVFQFDIVGLGCGETNKFEMHHFALPEFKKVIAKWQGFIENTDGWTTAFCENHDQGRSVSRFGSDAPAFRERSAKMLALLMSTMTGTLYIYQGQEIGTVNVPKDWMIEDLPDIESTNCWRDTMERTKGDGNALQKIMEGIQAVGRDNARLPMQWDDSSYAGFSTVKPWQRVHDLYQEINVAKQLHDPDSVLSFWRRMLKLRKEHREDFIYGHFRMYDVDNLNTFTFLKDGGNTKVLVVCNFSDEQQKCEIPKGLATKELLACSQSAEGSQASLRPWEGRVYLVE